MPSLSDKLFQWVIPSLLVFQGLGIAPAFAQPQAIPPDSLTPQWDTEEVVITAQYTPTDSRNAIMPVRVIDAATMIRRGAVNMEELLAGEVNFQFKTDMILGSGVSIRGVGGENVKILIDGVPVVGRMNGNVDLSQIPLTQVARVEIIEGPMSILYGSNASGGVINIITKKAPMGQAEGEYQAQAETIGLQTHHLRLGGRKGPWSIQGNAGMFEFNGIPDDNGSRSVTWNPKDQRYAGATLRFQPGDSTSFSYTFQAFEEEVANLGELRRPQFKPYAFDDYYTTQRRDHSLQVEKWLAPRWLMTFTAGYNDFQRFKNSYRFDQEDGANTLLPGLQDTNRFQAGMFRALFGSQRNASFDVQAGLEGNYELSSGDRILSPADSGATASMGDLAGFASLRWKPTRALSVQPSVRYGYNSRFTHPLLPALHFKYDLSGATSLRLGYARGFRAPSLKELFINFIDLNHFIIGNPDLQAEVSNTLTLRADSRKRLSRNWAADGFGELFYNHITDRIQLVQTSQLLQFSYRNIDQFTSYGVTGSLRVVHEKGSFLKVNASYTGLGRPEGAVTNLRTIDLFATAITSEGSWRINKLGADIGVLYRFTGPSPIFFLAETGGVSVGQISAQHLLNLTLTSRCWDNRLLFQAGIKNILDQREVNVGGTVGGVHSGGNGAQPIQMGRSYFLKMAFVISQWRL